MKYIKNGIIYTYIPLVVIEGVVTMNPTHEQILSAGYEVYTEPEEPEEPQEEPIVNSDFSYYVENGGIPKIFWEGTLPTSKDQGNIIGKVQFKAKDLEFNCYGTLKVQGNSTTAYNKKNFTLTFYKDAECSEKEKVDFNGWGKQSKFVIKANWIDLTHARNVVGARIWGKMFETRSGFDNYPEELRTAPNYGVVDGFPVKFYANGVYWGRYSFNIPKDGWMCNMNKNNQEQVILCSENYPGGCFHSLPRIDESDWTDELHSTVPSGITESFTAAVNFVITATGQTFKEQLSNYFDVESLIDYYIFGVVVCHLDGFGKNQLFMKYENTPYIAQVYDMDSTMGLWWNGQNFVSPTYSRESYQDYAEPTGGGGNLLYIKLANLFSDEISERWEELKDTVLSVNNLVLEYEKWTDICPKYLVEEDYATTTGRGAFGGIPLKETNNIGQIRNYIADRRLYCESKLGFAERYYTMNTSQISARPGANVIISIDTNLASSSSTITVIGNASFNQSTMTVTINSNATEGDVITINAVSNEDNTFTATTTITVVESTYEEIIWQDKTADGNTFLRNLSNGVDGDIDLAHGDYIELKIDYLNETSVNAELFGFGKNISEYNNTIHINNQQLPSTNTWVMIKSWAQTIAGSDSIQKGFNPGGELYVQIKSDNIYYSSNGETYTACDFDNKTAIFEALMDDIVSSEIVQIGSVQGTHPNGTYYDYVKIVKNGLPPQPTYYYNMSSSKAEAYADETITIAIATNLASTASTFNVTGPASFDSTGLTVTIDSTAATGSIITIEATSSEDSSFTATTSITVIAEPEKYYIVTCSTPTVQAGGSVDVQISTNLSSTASTFSVTGPALFDSTNMILVVPSSATAESVIELTATSSVDSEYTDSVSITVEEAQSDLVLINNKTSDGTSFVVTFTNGPTGDANFAGGDYLEYKLDFANETHAGELLGFGQSIQVYNENLHFVNEGLPESSKWVRWNSYVHTANSSGSLQKGINAGGTVIYVRYKSDGIYHSSDGETYTKLDLGSTQQPLYEGWWEASIASASNLQVGWNYNNSHPNGTVYEYVKVVKNSTPQYNYGISASKNEAIQGDTVNIEVSTNISSTASTFTVTGPATINSSTGVLTINPDATIGSIITIEAVSAVKSSYSASTTIEVVGIVYELSIEKNQALKNEALLASVSTNISSSASTFNVSGPATFDSSTMLLTINSNASSGSEITLTATSTIDATLTDSVTVTVITSNETIIWSNVNLGSTPLSRTLSNGTGGDIDFANGDYIEVKFDTTNETIGNARIFSFGKQIEAYNNTFNIEKQMNENSWVVFMGWFTVSTRSGFNPGYVFYARFTKDGVFYSSDGVNYTEAVLDDNPPTGAGTPYYREWYSEVIASSTIEIGHKYNNLPNGSIWEYVKIVKNVD